MHHILTLERGVNKENFLNELKADGIGVVKRKVDSPDEQQKSARNLTVDIDMAEREELLADSRVRDVVPVHEFDRMTPKKAGTQSINPVFSSAENGGHDNWALDHCAGRNGSTYKYTQDGAGIDIVIVDSGIHLDHDEFKDESGQSRIEQVEWEEGQSVNKPAHYTDSDGHGTAVASCAAGKTQGFARKAKILSVKIFDTDSYTPLSALQNIRSWHNAKTDGRPTIVNNSWVYTVDYPSNHPTEAGRVHPIQVSAIDAEIESMIDDGIIVVCAAGNDNHYVSSANDARYNEFYYLDANGNWTDDTSSGTETEAVTYRYTTRMSPGGADTALCVGSIGDHYASSRYARSYFSNKGTRVDAHAPGVSIQCAKRGTTTSLTKYDGTSFASPVVAGILGLYLQTHENANQDNAINYITEYGDKGEITGTLEGSNNLSVASLLNGLKIKNAGQIKPVAYCMLKQGGQWVRTNKISVNKEGSVETVFGTNRD